MRGKLTIYLCCIIWFRLKRGKLAFYCCEIFFVIKQLRSCLIVLWKQTLYLNFISVNCASNSSQSDRVVTVKILIWNLLKRGNEKQFKHFVWRLSWMISIESETTSKKFKKHFNFDICNEIRKKIWLMLEKKFQPRDIFEILKKILKKSLHNYFLRKIKTFFNDSISKKKSSQYCKETKISTLFARFSWLSKITWTFFLL